MNALTNQLPTYTAAEALKGGRRLRFSAANTVELADEQTDWIGFAATDAASGESVAVIPRNFDGTVMVEAGAAIGENAVCTADDDGKVDTGGAVTVGINPGAAVADGDYFEMMPYTLGA